MLCLLYQVVEKMQDEITESNSDVPKIIVKIPADAKMLARINLMAKFVATDGEAFDQVLYLYKWCK